MGDQRGIAYSLHNLGEICSEQKDWQAALRLYMESLILLSQIGDQYAIAYNLEGLARVACGQGQPSRAVRLWGAASALRQTIGSRPNPVEQEHVDALMASVREVLGEDGFAEAWTEGIGMTPEQAVGLALANQGSMSDERFSISN